MNGAIIPLDLDLEGDYKLDTDILVGTWNGSPLYLYVTEGSKSTTAWGSVKALPFNVNKIVKADYIAINSSNSNVSNPYYLSADNMFHAAADNGYLYAQLGNTYPARPATIRAFIYHT